MKTMATDKSKLFAYVKPDLKEKLEALAGLRMRSVSNLIEYVLAEEVARAERSGELPPPKDD